MDIKPLKFLVALEQTHPFGQAAARCHVTQPTLTPCPTRPSTGPLDYAAPRIALQPIADRLKNMANQDLSAHTPMMSGDS